MVARGEIIKVEICKSYKNTDTNPVVGVVRQGPLDSMIVIFDKYDPQSLSLEPGRFADVKVLHVMKNCLLGHFEAYTDKPFQKAV